MEPCVAGYGTVEWDTPWAQRNAQVIISQFLNQFNLSGGMGPSRIVGPDGAIYDSDFSTPLLPEGTHNPDNNTFTLRDSGETFALSSDPPDGGISTFASTGDPGLGPYRRVRTEAGFKAVTLNIAVPNPQHIRINQPGSETAFIYVGSSGRAEIDAGLQYSPATRSWAVTMRRWTSVVVGKGKRRRHVDVVAHYANPRRIAMEDDWPAYVEYYTMEPGPGPRAALVRVSAFEVVNGSITGLKVRTAGVGYTGYAGNESVKLKRVISIGQARSSAGVTRTGSYLGVLGNLGTWFISPSLTYENGGTDLWDASHVSEDVKYEGPGNPPPATINYGGSIDSETNVRITIH